MQPDTSKLIHALVRLGFSDAVCQSLEQQLQTEAPSVSSIPFISIEADNYEFRFQPAVNEKLQYELANIEAKLYRKLFFWHLGSSDYEVAILELKMSQLSWKVPMEGWSGHMLDNWNGIKADLYQISSNAQGRKVAGLLIARYCPEAIDLDDLMPPGLRYNNQRDKYYVQYSAGVADAITAQQITALLRDEFHEKMPHLYQVKLLIKGHEQDGIAIVMSQASFVDFGRAGDLLNKAHHGYFQEESMKRLQMPWRILEGEIIDTVDNLSVVTKKIDVQKLDGPPHQAFMIDFHLHERKIGASWYHEHASFALPFLMGNTGNAQAFAQLFQPLCPLGKKLLEPAAPMHEKVAAKRQRRNRT